MTLPLHISVIYSIYDIHQHSKLWPIQIWLIFFYLENDKSTFRKRYPKKTMSEN